jgi:hypothetical protein
MAADRAKVSFPAFSRPWHRVTRIVTCLHTRAMGITNIKGSQTRSPQYKRSFYRFIFTTVPHPLTPVVEKSATKCQLGPEYLLPTLPQGRYFCAPIRPQHYCVRGCQKDHSGAMHGFDHVPMRVLGPLARGHLCHPAIRRLIRSCSV